MNVDSAVANIGTGSISANNITIETDSASTVQHAGGPKVHASVFNFGTGNIAARGNIKVTKLNSAGAGAAASANQTATEPNADELTFVVSGYQFTVNRSTLAQNAPDFETQFQGKNLFEINDIAPELFQVLLNYLQKVAMPEEKHVADLLILANRYNLNDLKNQCEEFLKTKLDAQWAIELLKLAVKCNAFKLKAAAMAFINNLIKTNPDFQNTDDFQQVSHLFK